MSIQIHKQGLSDSIQDSGRYGYQHMGIQVNGCIDYLSARLANTLLQNDIENPVFEIHFPASSFTFLSAQIICITGANFVPVLNEQSIPLFTPIQMNAGDCLQFLQPLDGRTAYMAVKGVINCEEWLDSYSFTNRRLQKNEEFSIMKESADSSSLLNNTKTAFLENLTHKVQAHLQNHLPIRIIPGPAWNTLEANSIQQLLHGHFEISSQANRMGFPLKGPVLFQQKSEEPLSSAVTRGTLQLLPSGELIVLMADHQTIGGYANLGQIILVDLPRLAQLKKESPFTFSLVNVEEAHQIYLKINEWFKH